RGRKTDGHRLAAALRTPAFLLMGLAAAAMIALGLAQAFAHTAEAHATLIRSNPGNQEKLQRSPLRVTLNFSESIERRLTEIKVTDSREERVDDGKVAFDDSDSKFASVGLKKLDPGL